MKANNLKQILFFFGLVIIIVVVLVYPHDNKYKKIGVILPLTGPVASMGESAKNAVMLAQKSLNDSGYIRDAIFEDDLFDPKITVLAYNKLKDIDNVSSIICFASSPCNAIAPLAERDHIILIAIASDPTVQVNKRYVFRLEISTSVEAKKISDYIKSKEYKTISSIVAIQSGVQSAYKELIKDTQINNLIVSNNNSPVGESDYRSILVKLLEVKPQAILVGLLPGDAGVFTKQARNLGFKGDFLGFNFIEGEETLRAGGGSLEGIVYSQADSYSLWFTNLYQKNYSVSPNPGSAHVYDAFNLLVQAGNGRNTNGFIDYIESLKDYNGALGIFSSNTNHEFSLPVTLKTVRRGKFVKL